MITSDKSGFLLNDLTGCDDDFLVQKDGLVLLLSPPLSSSRPPAAFVSLLPGQHVALFLH